MLAAATAMVQRGTHCLITPIAAQLGFHAAWCRGISGLVICILAQLLGVDEALAATLAGGESTAATAADADESLGSIWFGAALFGLPLGLICLVLLRARKALQATVRQLEAANRDLQLQLHQRTGELASSTAAMRRMSRNLDQMREAERIHIARELHDGLGATLTALELELAGSADSPARTLPVRQRRAGANLVDEAMDVVQRIIDKMRPSALDRHGLWEAMRWKAQQYEKSTQIECRIEIPEDLLQPPDDVAIAIFRVFEESLTNVARHADARSVQVCVRQTPEGLDIEVVDDGCGIRAEQLRGVRSFGLMGMHERASGVGGKLHIGRGSHGGTVTRLQLPPSSLHATH
jgi:signal transduction histidine kinase